MVIELAISIISLIIGYFISRLLERHSEKYTRKSERFEKLYAPFEKMVWLHTHGAFQFSDLDPALQRQFFELLFKHYEYADSKLKELLLRFKWVYDIPAAKDTEEADKCFFMIQQHISLVFNALCRDLFLEPYPIKHADKITEKCDKLL